MSCQRVLDRALPADAEVESVHHLHLDPRPRLVAEARRFVLAHAPDLPVETLETLALLTSELVTNAVLHARTPVEVGITVADVCLLVAVHDLDLARREQQPYPPREGGWGLGMVEALSDASAMQVHPGEGKTAWFRLARAAAAAPPDGAASRARATSEDDADVCQGPAA